MRYISSVGRDLNLRRIYLYRFTRIINAAVLLFFSNVVQPFTIDPIDLQTPSQSSDNCKQIYKSQSQLLSGKDTKQVAILPKPPKGIAILDPSYKSCRLRVTDFKNEPPKGFARNDYSRRQPFNADDSYMLVYARNGYWHLYETATQKYYKKLNLGGGSVEPQWHPSDPKSLFVLPNNGGLKISRYNIDSDRFTTVADFTDIISINGYPGKTSILDIWPKAARVWTKSEGSPSVDARYWAFQVETSKFSPLGLITYDLVDNVISGVFDFSKDGKGIGRPDHVSMSPSGDFVVPSWHVPNNCPNKYTHGTFKQPCGLMVYSRDFKTGFGITSRGPHSDIAIDKQGNDVIVISNYVTGYVEMHNLVNRKKTNLWKIYVGGSATAMHFSGKSYKKPGWVLVSTYATTKDTQWWTNKIMAVELNKRPLIYMISHTYTKDAGYWAEPHAVANRDFSKIIFNSNWLSATQEMDVYMIELPDNAIH